MVSDGGLATRYDKHAISYRRRDRAQRDAKHP